MTRVFRSTAPARLRLLAFDLDGTLIDSVADLCASVNAMLRHFGLPQLPNSVIATYIGDGVAALVGRAIGGAESAPPPEEAIEFFLNYYREHKLDRTYVYSGVFEALRALRQAPGGGQLAMAVLTNKPMHPSRAICDALGLTPFFFRIYGGNSFPTKKPDPEGLLTLMREAGAEPEETVMIGDSGVDILTARAAGAWSIGCAYGLAPHTLEAARPDCMADSPAAWLEALGLLCPPLLCPDP